jgi:hypothetical protein
LGLRFAPRWTRPTQPADLGREAKLQIPKLPTQTFETAII